MVGRRKVGVKDTPTKNTMNIYLLNIPFAVLGVAIAVVPLIVGMKHQSRNKLDVIAVESDVAFSDDHPEDELEYAA
jgi:hypothetical protein